MHVCVCLCVLHIITPLLYSFSDDVKKDVVCIPLPTQGHTAAAMSVKYMYVSYIPAQCACAKFTWRAIKKFKDQSKPTHVLLDVRCCNSVGDNSNAL